jgi:hypothetical protein
MNKILLILLILGILVQTTSANILAVLEITPSAADEQPALTIQEFRHLTDELRTQARNALPQNYTILTRDNILQLLPPDEAERECLAEGCAVDVGRAIGAEYVTQGTIGNFQGMLTLTVELYESMTGNMLGSFVTESENAKGLLGTIREKAPALFEKLSEPKKELRMENGELKIEEKPLATNHLPLATKKSSTWLAISLDILGAAALGFGIYKHIDGNKLYDNYKKPPDKSKTWSTEEIKEFEENKSSELKKVNSARTARNISLIAGGALLAGGIAVHIWF